MILCMQGPHTCQKQEVIHSTPQSRRFDSGAVCAAWGTRKSTENKAQLSASGMGFAVVVTSQYTRDIPVYQGHPGVSGTSQCVGEILAHQGHPSGTQPGPARGKWAA